MIDEEYTLVNGTDIRMMRECAGKSTTEIASSLGMDTTARYDTWENDKDLPDMNEFMQLSIVCGFDPAQLISVLSNKKGDLQIEDFRKMHVQG